MNKFITFLIALTVASTTFAGTLKMTCHSSKHKIIILTDDDCGAHQSSEAQTIVLSKVKNSSGKQILKMVLNEKARVTCNFWPKGTSLSTVAQDKMEETVGSSPALREADEEQISLAAARQLKFGFNYMSSAYDGNYVVYGLNGKSSKLSVDSCTIE
jgi:hypothetical protein